jgi:hypothetical protein
LKNESENKDNIEISNTNINEKIENLEKLN